jgi:hypothetical protein
MGPVNDTSTYTGRFSILPGVTVEFHGPIVVDLFFQDDERPSATASMAAAGRPLYLTGRQSATFEVNQHESLGLSIAQRETPWHLFDGKPVVCANTWPSR